MKINQKLFCRLFTLPLLSLGACGIYENKVQPRPLNEINSLLHQTSKTSFSQVNATIIQPNCTRCHHPGKVGGGVLLDTYENVKANLDDVRYVTIVEKSMPQDTGPLPVEQMTLLRRWIDDGAPNVVVGATPVATPVATPSATPIAAPVPVVTPTPVAQATPAETATPAPSGTPVLMASYASIREQIFAVKCLKCHGAQGVASDYPLDDYAKMIAQGELILPGNPEGSTVVQQIERGKMPSKSSGVPQVTPEELAAIKIWIVNGAKP